MLTAFFRMTGLSLTLAAGLGACGLANFGPKSEPQPQTAVTTISSEPFGPRQPESGFDASGVVPIAGNSGIFGTDDEISVTDSGPYADNASALDPALYDSGEGDLALLDGQYGNDAALLSGVSLPGDDGTAAYFDSDVGTTVYFDTDSSELSDESRETLRKQAAWLQVNKNATATIEGHTDERGTRQYNLALGERRASAVRGYMIALGVDASRVRKVSYGKERPAALGSDDSAWSQNRRSATSVEVGSSSVLVGDATPAPASPSPASIYDDPLLDPSLDALLGTNNADPLGDIPDNPVLNRIDTGS